MAHTGTPACALRLESHIGAQPAAQALLPVPLHLESNIGAQPRVAVLQTPVGSASAGSNFSELVFFPQTSTLCPDSLPNSCAAKKPARRKAQRSLKAGAPSSRTWPEPAEAGARVGVLSSLSILQLRASAPPTKGYGRGGGEPARCRGFGRPTLAPSRPPRRLGTGARMGHPLGLEVRGLHLFTRGSEP